MKQEVIQKHYSRLADDYDEYLYYSPEFVRTLTSKMVAHLDLQRGDRLADIGCGTGMYSADILKQVTLNQPVLGVDPFAQMLAQIPQGTTIEPICQGALEFSRENYTYDKVLIKETIHHVDEQEEFFANLYQRLPVGGRILLVHVPPDVQYPLFQAALDRCMKWHADPDKLEAGLANTGFEITRSALDYPHVLPKEHYFKMVKACYMSVLTSFDEAELQEGLKEIEEKYQIVEQLSFVDHFDYILGTKVS